MPTRLEDLECLFAERVRADLNGNATEVVYRPPGRPYIGASLHKNENGQGSAARLFPWFLGSGLDQAIYFQLALRLSWAVRMMTLLRAIGEVLTRFVSLSNRRTRISALSPGPCADVHRVRIGILRLAFLDVLFRPAQLLRNGKVQIRIFSSLQN